MDIPVDLRYTSDHEWVRAHNSDDSSTRVTVGITAYAGDALGDVVFVELPEVEAVVASSATMGEVESTKSVSDLYAPLDGIIVRVNEKLAQNPGLVNSDPYGAGWLCEMLVSDTSGLDGLLDAASYRELTGE